MTPRARRPSFRDAVDAIVRTYPTRGSDGQLVACIVIAETWDVSLDAVQVAVDARVKRHKLERSIRTDIQRVRK